MRNAMWKRFLIYILSTTTPIFTFRDHFYKIYDVRKREQQKLSSRPTHLFLLPITRDRFRSLACSFVVFFFNKLTDDNNYGPTVGEATKLILSEAINQGGLKKVINGGDLYSDCLLVGVVWLSLCQVTYHRLWNETG